MQPITKEEIKTGIIDPLSVVWGFGKSFIKNEDAEELTEYALDKFANAPEADVDDLIAAVITGAKTFAARSATNVDDKIVELLEIAAKVKTGEAKPVELIGKAFELIGPAIKLARENKAKKKAAKEEAQGEGN